MKRISSKEPLKYLTPDNLFDQINHFTSGMAVTRNKFELIIPKCTLEDLEWNHMDQMHRLSIHNTYEKAVRIACGPDFAVSLTQWKNWPFFITVTDVYVDKGLFYQSLTIAGIIFLHSIIKMEPIAGTDNVKLTDEWFIASKKIFRLLHKPLDKMLYKLNSRLQEEDEQIRQGRFELRKKGFTFKTDHPDYYNSNRLTTNTIYPPLENNAFLSLENVGSEAKAQSVGNLEFITKQDIDGSYLVWPAACPHEGGPMMSGKICETQITCPWHSLRFSAVKLSTNSPHGSRYGFEYTLVDKKIYVMQTTTLTCASNQETLTISA